MVSRICSTPLWRKRMDDDTKISVIAVVANWNGPGRENAATVELMRHVKRKFESLSWWRCEVSLRLAPEQL
ncbi:hypothetical protein GN244_ATG06743 [Phytophthora infestans]|uniref:Uncharacterized protein n=1 Tax=Phytophthora infestans TaxID=4787 RepID=A0A833WXA4_PHYIN|nr:hypothetical protein GN244_ATG06743 [Phytophthora infestans]